MAKHGWHEEVQAASPSLVIAELTPDEQKLATAIARQMGAKLSGFPGALLLAVQAGLISAKDLKVRLEKCRAQGTHYGTAFIQQVYEMAKRGRR